MLVGSHNDASQSPRGRPSLAEAQSALGVPVATLTSPDSAATIGTHAEEASAHGYTRRNHVTEVRVSYIGSGIDVVTYRLEHGHSVAQVTWQTLINHRLAAAGKTGVPWGAGPPPEDMIAALDVNSPPRTDDIFDVTVDDVLHHWYGFTSADFTTGAPLAACGGIIHEAIVVVAGPPELINGTNLSSWTNPADPSGDPRRW